MYRLKAVHQNFQGQLPPVHLCQGHDPHVLRIMEEDMVARERRPWPSRIVWAVLLHVYSLGRPSDPCASHAHILEPWRA